MTRFKYPRHNLCIRVSTSLDKEIDRAAEALQATKTDIVVYALLLMLDPTGHGCDDVEHLPQVLRDDFKPRVRDKFTDHFFKSENIKSIYSDVLPK